MATISIRVSDRSTVATTTELRVGVVSIWARVARWLRSMWCVINGGHFKVLHTEPDRMALRCVACGHTSPGWAVGSPRMRRAMPADPERLRAVRRHIAA